MLIASNQIQIKICNWKFNCCANMQTKSKRSFLFFDYIMLLKFLIEVTHSEFSQLWKSFLKIKDGQHQQRQNIITSSQMNFEIEFLNRPSFRVSVLLLWKTYSGRWRLLFCDKSKFNLQSKNSRFFIWPESAIWIHPEFIWERPHHRGGALMEWAEIDSLYVSAFYLEYFKKIQMRFFSFVCTIGPRL